ncbi:MAG: type II toxin-antitoxin system RelE/ParE family toxin [Chthoniobacteraceae bacterium]
MGRPVVLALQAQRDLEEIVRYIARDNPFAAEKLGQALHAQARSLSESPELGPKVRGWRHVRALLHRAYYIVYRCDPAVDRIEVLRFWHSARDLTKLRLR